MARCVRRDLDCIVTTEKDSVRFPYKLPTQEMPVLFLRVEIKILTGHESWQSLVDRICQPHSMMSPSRFFA